MSCAQACLDFFSKDAFAEMALKRIKKTIVSLRSAGNFINIETRNSLVQHSSVRRSLKSIYKNDSHHLDDRLIFISINY